MIGPQSDLIGTDAGGSEPMAEDESNGSATRLSQEVKSVFSSITTESAASMAGSIHPSMDSAAGSELRVGAVVGAISWTLSDGRAKSCSS